MWKPVLIGTAALAIVGSSIVYAQQRMGGPEQRQRWQFSQEDIAAFAAARIAALKAGLALTPDQAKNWPAFETALNDLARYRMERRAARRDREPSNDPTERLRRRAEALSGYGAALKKLADAQEPLYGSLDDAQKRRFAILGRQLRRGGWGHHRGHHGDHHPGMRGERGDRPGFQRRSEDWRGGEQGPRRNWRNRSDAEPRDDGRQRGDGDRRRTTGEGERL